VINEDDVAQRSSPRLLVGETKDWVLAGQTTMLGRQFITLKPAYPQERMTFTWLINRRAWMSTWVW
jgi:hypothetical protein